MEKNEKYGEQSDYDRCINRDGGFFILSYRNYSQNKGRNACQEYQDGDIPPAVIKGKKAQCFDQKNGNDDYGQEEYVQSDRPFSRFCSWPYFHIPI